MNRLKNKKIAIFLEDYYEDLEFWYPYIRMKEEGAQIVKIAPEVKEYTGKNGLKVKSEKSINDVKYEEFNALIIPGGYSPDRMRRSREMIQFVQDMNDHSKPIAAICHAGWMLVSAGIIKNKNVTSFFSIKDDMINAGGNWTDQEVVIDGNIITSRNPDDLPAFCNALINSLSD